MDMTNNNGDLEYKGHIIPRARRTLTEIYTRVVGYIRPISQFNKAKRQEHEDRKEFEVTEKGER